MVPVESSLPDISGLKMIRSTGHERLSARIHAEILTTLIGRTGPMRCGVGLLSMAV